MIQVSTKGHGYEYEISNLLKAFFPQEEIYVNQEGQNPELMIQSMWDEKNRFSTVIQKDGETIASHFMERDLTNIQEDIERRKVSKRWVKFSLFSALKQFTQREIPYGILTGIRPTKIVHEYLEEGKKEAEILELLEEEYFIAKDKAQLLLEVSKRELSILKDNHQKLISIYIGIPFCRTRCVYCSFTANLLSQYKNKIDVYLEALKKEISFLGEFVKEHGYEVDCIYIGGGTPTSLSAQQMEELLQCIAQYFDTKALREYTVEAGRPDTITKEKLEVIHKYSVNRISINPQSMVERTLKKVGRSHNAEDIIVCFEEARELGFNNINMDLILGLPGEDLEDVKYTVQQVLKLQPENITVHTLAIKSASLLKQDLDQYEVTQAQMVQDMVEYSREALQEQGYVPYYMYRQKNIMGNLENIGYAKSGYEGIYNVQIMEEKQSIFALGAGATSKVVDLSCNRIERVFNVKNVDEYVNRVDEMIERKRRGLIL